MEPQRKAYLLLELLVFPVPDHCYLAQTADLS